MATDFFPQFPQVPIEGPIVESLTIIPGDVKDGESTNVKDGDVMWFGDSVQFSQVLLCGFVSLVGDVLWILPW